jgi:hypothetical protein
MWYATAVGRKDTSLETAAARTKLLVTLLWLDVALITSWTTAT